MLAVQLKQTFTKIAPSGSKTMKMIPDLPVQFHGNLTPLTNALTNQIYQIECFSSKTKYLLRIFGPLLSRKYENTILQYLGNSGHPVKIEHIGDGYRIETWLDHSEVKPHELPKFKDEIAQLLGWYHSLSPPIEKTNVIYDGLVAMANDAEFELPIEYLDLLKDDELVLCHNDLQYGNILKTKKGLVFVDFEYSGYVSRYFDIANHFCEYMADYTANEPELMVHTKFPSKESRMSFYTSYLGELRNRSVSATDEKYEEDQTTDLERFDRQVGLYTLLSHLYWGVWGLYKSKNESRLFDYLKYGTARLDRFTYLWDSKMGEGNIPLLT